MLTSAVFSDMSKALDSVYHETLTLKLQDVCASLTAAFRRDVSSDHFYLAYTLIFSFSTTEMQRPELCIRH